MIFLKIKGVPVKHVLIVLIATSSIFAMDSTQQKWDGTYYKRNSSPQFLSALKLLQTEDLSSCKHIVDIGCGSGDVTQLITVMAPLAHAVGSDASESMIQKAKETYAHNTRLSFERVDAQDESHAFFKEARFDLAFSSAALLWMANKQAVFNNIHRMLKAGGRMLVKTTQPLAPNHPLMHTLGTLAKNPKWLPFVRAYQSQPQHFPLSKEAAQKMISHDHWTEISFEESSIVNRFETEADLGKWMKGWMGALPAFKLLSPDQQTELNTEFVSIYAQIPGTRGDGKILYTLPGLIIRTTKK